MAKQIPDLWPDDITVSKLRLPVTVLRQQATFLGEKTQNIVQGEISSTVGDDDAGKGPYFRHSFHLKTPALGNYRFRLFYIVHSDDLYPLDIFKEGEDPIPVESEEAFVEALRQVFSSEKTKRIVRTLIAQSEEPS